MTGTPTQDSALARVRNLSDRERMLLLGYLCGRDAALLTVALDRMDSLAGDSLARIFAFEGGIVTREYYFNDHGAQIDRFARSLVASWAGEPVPDAVVEVAPAVTVMIAPAVKD